MLWLGRYLCKEEYKISWIRYLGWQNILLLIEEEGGGGGCFGLSSWPPYSGGMMHNFRNQRKKRCEKDNALEVSPGPP